MVNESNRLNNLRIEGEESWMQVCLVSFVLLLTKSKVLFQNCTDYFRNSRINLQTWNLIFMHQHTHTHTSNCNKRERGEENFSFYQVGTTMSNEQNIFRGGHISGSHESNPYNKPTTQKWWAHYQIDIIWWIVMLLFYFILFYQAI